MQTTLNRLEKLRKELRKENQRLDADIAATDECQAKEKSKLDQSFAKIHMLLEARKEQLLEDLTTNLAQEKARLQQMQQGFSNDLESVCSCEELLKGLESNPVGDEVVYDMLQAIGDQVKCHLQCLSSFCDYSVLLLMIDINLFKVRKRERDKLRCCASVLCVRSFSSNQPILIIKMFFFILYNSYIYAYVNEAFWNTLIIYM